MAWCEVDDVFELAQPGRMYSDGDTASNLRPTTPTKTMVENIIEKIHTDMVMRIRAAGYNPAMVEKDEFARRWLSMVNATGAAARAEAARTGETGKDISERAKQLAMDYDTYMLDVEDKPGFLDMSSNKGNRPFSLTSLEKTDGTDSNFSNITPWFTRDMRL